MSNRLEARQERRRCPRIALKGTVILLGNEHAQRGRIANIANGGLLATTAVTAAAKLLGRSVDLELRLDGQGSEWLRLVGRVARIEANTVAVAFEKVPTPFIRLIDAMSRASLGHQRVLNVVLVDEVTDRRLAMAEAFRSAGCTVVDVATPLESIVRLGELPFEPDVIAIADSLAATTSEHLRHFVEREHPHAKLVTIGDNVVEPEGLAHWLSSANPGSDLAARIRQVLTSPRR